MGFMAGFGDAFANSYENARERSSRREDDILRYTYDNYARRQDKWDEYQREDAKLIKAAKSIEEQTGKAGTWPKIYEWLSTGTSLDDARRLAAKGTFEVEKPSVANPVEPDQVGNSGNVNPGNPGTQAANPANTGGQTEQAFGMVKPTDPAQRAAQPAQDDSPHGGIMSTFFGKKFADKMRPQGGADKAVQQIAKMTGQTPEQVQRVMNSTYTSDAPSSAGIKFTPPAEDEWGGGGFPTQAEAQHKLDLAIAAGDKTGMELWGGIVKAHQETVSSSERAKNPQGVQTAIVSKGDGTMETVNITQTPDGWKSRDGRTFTDDEVDILNDHDLKQRDELVAGTKEAADLQQRQAKALSVMATAHDMMEYVKNNPGVVTHVGNLASTINSLSADAQQLIQLIDDGKAPANAYQMLKNEEKKIDDQLSKAHDLGEQTTLFNSKATLMTYEIGQAMGQGARSFTKDDYNKVYNSIVAGDPETFQKNMKEYVNKMIGDLDTESKNFNDYNTRLSDFENIHGKGSAPAGATIKSMKELAAGTNDPRVQSWVSGDTQVQQHLENTEGPKQVAPPEMMDKLQKVLADPNIPLKEKQKAIEAFGKHWDMPPDQPQE